MNPKDIDINSFYEGFTQGWDKGWDAHESFIEQKIMERDPAFLKWLDKMNRLSLVALARHELELLHQWAMQQDQDDNAPQY